MIQKKTNVNQPQDGAADKPKKTVGSIYSGMNSPNSISHGISSIVRKSNLLSSDMATDANSYYAWGSFGMAADVDALDKTEAFKQDGTDAKGNPQYVMKEPGERKKVESTGVKSIFNKFHSVGLDNTAYHVRLSTNTPLLDSPQNRQLQRSMNACTVRDLVQKSHQGLLGMAMYEYSDFMYCKHLGRIPNNHLITLRRYAIPVNDYIKPYGNPSLVNGDANGITSKAENGGVPLATMVTWMGTPGNEMNEIMKYSFSMPFKELKSDFHDDGSPSPQAVNKNSGGAIGGAFSKAFSNNAYAQRAGNILWPGIYNRRGDASMSYPGPKYQANKTYAGVDMIKSIYTRDGETGLSFNHEFTLTFDYELKSYDGINGKQAMLDLLANILTCCYTTGDFWPGAYRHTQGSAGYTPMSSLECMKHHNTFTGYVNAFQKDFETLKGRVKSLGSNPIEVIKNLLNNLGGILMGGDSNVAPPQVKSALDALLSDTTVGFWHVTIGNPCAPMMSIGNLILSNCTIEHYGPLGIDDFPTGLKVTCTFKHGKPRDKRLIERMYGSGTDRIYTPFDDTVLDALNKAAAMNNALTDGGDGKPVTSTEKMTAAAAAGNVKENVPLDNAEIQKRLQEANAAYSEMMNGAQATTVGGNKVARAGIMDDLNGAALSKRLFGTESIKAIYFPAGEAAEGVQVQPESNPQTTKV